MPINNFLKDQYQLHASKEVQNTIKREKKLGYKVSQKPTEVIGIFLKRFEDILNQKDQKKKEKSLEGLKRKILSQNIIKPQDIPLGYWNLQKRILRERGMGDIELPEDIKRQEIERIITEQKSSLEYWIDYLSSNDANYPMGLKYWAFRSILSLQNFDRDRGIFPERSKGTVGMFPELDQESLSYTFGFIQAKLKKQAIQKPHEEVDENQFQAVLQKESFANIYAFAFKNSKKVSEELFKETRGEWIKYQRGSDYLPLTESLKGKGTGWCTVGESTAKSQLIGGDFYVYYSLDQTGKATIPRIAIRMQGNEIGEIRGILPGQSLDPYILPVLDEKLNEFGKRGNIYKKKISDMKMMTEIDEKTKKGEELTQEEIRFLYEIDGEIKGFGYYKDPRVQEITSKRDLIQDLSVIFNCQKNQISTSQKEFLDGNTRYHYGDLDVNIDTFGGETVILPRYIVGNIVLQGTGENLKKIVLPDYVKGNCICNQLTCFTGVVFPKKIGGNFGLAGVNEISDNFHIRTDVYGTLNLSGLKSIEKTLSFRKIFHGSIELSGLQRLIGLNLPQEIIGNVNLGGGKIFNALQNLPKDIIFSLPRKIGGTLKIDIRCAEGIVFPDYIGENLTFSSLNTRDGLDLSKTQVCGKTDMMALTLREISKSPGFIAHVSRYMGDAFW